MSAQGPRPPKAKSRRPRRSREELRQATLDAARQIIREEGPEGLTARRLAKAVGYTPGTIYNLFDGLADVLWQVNRLHFARIAGLFTDLPEGSPQLRLQTLAARYLDLVETEPTLFRALFDGARKSERFPDWYTGAISGLLDLAAHELSALAPAMLRADARREAASLFAAVQGLAQLRISGRLDLLTDESPTVLAEAMFARILRDLEQRGY